MSLMLPSSCVPPRCRLSCTEALAHPWMVSFTPLTRRPTKSLNKGKMKRFLAKRKWKVAASVCLSVIEQVEQG